MIFKWFTPYRSVNTLYVVCKNESLGNVWEIIAVWSEIYIKTHKCTVLAEYRNSECSIWWYM